MFSVSTPVGLVYLAVQAAAVDPAVAHRGRPEDVAVDRRANRRSYFPEHLADVEGQCADVPANALLESCLEPQACSVPVAESASFASAVKRSIGIGKTMVELLAEPISSRVCR